MNSSLKQKIEEAAERRGFAAGLGERWEAEESFKAGAQFLLDEGYQFTRDDIIDFLEFYKFEFFKVNRILNLEDKRSKKGSEIEPIVVDLWIEKRSKSK